MRISDWSSDVCSSDLDWLVRRRGRAVRCLLGIAALLGWFVGGHLLLATLYRPAATARPAAVTMLTRLPLRWAQGDDMAARSEERRVGKECVRTCRSRWSPVP